jgi:hypothetical protein
MTLDPQQVNVQELQRLNDAIATTLDAIRRVAPQLAMLQQHQLFGGIGQFGVGVPFGGIGQHLGIPGIGVGMPWHQQMSTPWTQQYGSPWATPFQTQPYSTPWTQQPWTQQYGSPWTQQYPFQSTQASPFVNLAQRPF